MGDLFLKKKLFRIDISSRQKINKDTENVNTELDPMDINRNWYLIIKECLFFSDTLNN